jgi:DNA-binding response OmpR family regulator
MSKRILIVEDDRVLRRACEAGLRKRGYDVVSAADGEEGLALATSQTFDLVLLDMLMPRMSGLDMLRELRRRAPEYDVPILVLSNSSRPGDRLDAQELGAAGYMVKASLSLDHLAGLVTSLTARAPAGGVA